MSDYEKHPSWGMAEFSRATHGGPVRLFGSSLKQHATTVVLSIRKGERKHELGQDWYSADEELIEVEFSAAQFAALLTTMNIANGVPCTIRRVLMERMPDVPEDLRETERVQESARVRFEGITGSLRELVEQADALLKRGDLKAGERRNTRDLLAKIAQDIEANMPFMLRQFEEATEKIATAAKAEVDAFLTTAATRLGMKRLAEIAKGGVELVADVDAPRLEKGSGR